MKLTIPRIINPFSKPSEMDKMPEMVNNLATIPIPQSSAPNKPKVQIGL